MPPMASKATKVLDFEEAIKKAGKSDTSRPVLLLGNGFSRGYSNEFGYHRLRDIADMPDLNVPKDALFEHAGSDDFETVINNLRKSASLIELYDPADSALRDSLLHDADLVKRGLVDALSSIHPGSSTDIPDSKYRSAREFLSNFRRIFTLSYDLLLYWTVNMPFKPDVVKTDGFGRDDGVLTWHRPRVPNAQQVLWLHGAVHFHVRDHRVRKLEWADGRLMDQLHLNLARGRYPLVVTEGSREDKEARIARSAYLTYCHYRLQRTGGTVFIHGMALSENDDHVLESLTYKESRVEHVYVGVFGPPSKERTAVEARALGLAHERKANGGSELKVHLYDTGSADVWG
jgi:uncharacterized protein DUF4917